MATPVNSDKTTFLFTAEEAMDADVPQTRYSFAGYPVKLVDGQGEWVNKAISDNICRYCVDLAENLYQVTTEQSDVLCKEHAEAFKADPEMKITGNPRIDEPIRARRTEQWLDDVKIHCPYSKNCEETVTFGQLREFVNRESRDVTENDRQLNKLRHQYRVDYERERGTGHFSAIKKDKDTKYGGHLYECSERFQQCKHCSLVFPRSKLLTTHKSECSAIGTTPGGEKKLLEYRKCKFCNDTYFLSDEVRHLSLCLPRKTPQTLEKIKDLEHDQLVNLAHQYRSNLYQIRRNYEITVMNLHDSYQKLIQSEQVKKDTVEKITTLVNSEMDRFKEQTEAMITELTPTLIEQGREEMRPELQKYKTCEAYHKMLRQLKKQPTLKQIKSETLSTREKDLLKAAKQDDSLKTKYRIEALEKLEITSEDTFITNKGCTMISRKEQPEEMMLYFPDVGSLTEQSGEIQFNHVINGVTIVISPFKQTDGKLNLAFHMQDRRDRDAQPTAVLKCNVFSVHPLYCSKISINMLGFESTSPELKIMKKGINVTQNDLTGQVTANDLLLHIKVENLKLTQTTKKK